MRVAVEADECGLRGKVGLGFRVVVDVVELGWLIERGVGESDGIDIGCDRLRPQPGFLGFGELLVGELKRLADRYVPVLVCDFIGNGKHGFMVAENADGAGIHDSLHTHGRFRAVAHSVTETESSLHGKLLDVGKHSREGVDVCVDIAEDSEEGILGFRHGILVGGALHAGPEELVFLRGEVGADKLAFQWSYDTGTGDAPPDQDADFFNIRE